MTWETKWREMVTRPHEIGSMLYRSTHFVIPLQIFPLAFLTSFPVVVQLDLRILPVASCSVVKKKLSRVLDI